jgi:signal transduction histidine kinase
VTEVICGALLFVGTFFSFPWTRGRHIHYCFAFVANAAYFAVGPRAALLVLGAGAAGVLVHFVRSRRSATGCVESLVAAALASSLAMLVTHGARAALGWRGYPLPFDAPGDVGRFMASLLLLYIAFTTSKEALLRLFLRRTEIREDEEAPPDAETSPALYALGGVVGAPMQFAAYAVYARDTLVSWAFVMLWSLLVNAVIAREVARMRHVGVLMRELAAKERLAAIGEVTARIVHQTRHQLGLIGISAHRIERRIGGLPEEDAAVVRDELSKLGEVQEELRRMLARDLRGETGPRASYASLVRGVAARLEGLAAARGVRVAVDALAPAEARSPRDAENVSQALFNVLENAIVAARAEVRVRASEGGEGLVLSIVDDGPGMPPSIAARAMEPFVTGKADGTGMGLPIARAAASEEGGELRIANRREGGLAVDFVFPAERDLRHA